MSLIFANVNLGKSNQLMEWVVSSCNLFIGLTKCSHRPCGESCDGLFLSHVTLWIDRFSVRCDKYNRTSVQTNIATFSLIYYAFAGHFWRELKSHPRLTSLTLHCSHARHNMLKLPVQLNSLALESLWSCVISVVVCVFSFAFVPSSGRTPLLLLYHHLGVKWVLLDGFLGGLRKAAELYVSTTLL